MRDRAQLVISAYDTGLVRPPLAGRRSGIAAHRATIIDHRL